MSSPSSISVFSKFIPPCTLIAEFRTKTPTLQQSLARLAGMLDYKAHRNGLENVIACLLESVDDKVFINIYSRSCLWI